MNLTDHQQRILNAIANMVGMAIYAKPEFLNNVVLLFAGAKDGSDAVMMYPEDCKPAVDNMLVQAIKRQTSSYAKFNPSSGEVTFVRNEDNERLDALH